ncbi:MAG: GDSL-type esterase/lipase family protein [Acetobacteraceae bacterium]
MGPILLAAALAFGVAAPTAARTILAATPISRLDLPWWKHRFEAKQHRLHDGPVKLVFYGDSITQDWEHSGPPAWDDFAPIWQHFYGGRDAVNLGFKGDTTASLLWRITHGEADGISPKAAVILIGANNMGHLHWSADDTLAGIDAIIAALRQRLPHTRLLLLSVLPSERSDWVTRTTREINRDLAARYADGRVADVTYLDVTGVFERDGKFDRSAFLDPLLTPPDPPLHPTAQAQGRMAAAMEPTLAGMLGDTSHQQR